MVSHTSGTYPIIIGNAIYSDQTILRDFIHGTQVLIVTDEHVAPQYLSALKTALSDFRCNTVILPPGETIKTLHTFEQILSTCANNHHHRDTTLIALGGGVVCDITGFTAACYHRGVRWLCIPTTLLAQVDAAIGGKTAVNHAAGKNLIGAFHPPTAVITDINMLNTLPDREYRAGFAEIIKAALINDRPFFEWLQKNAAALLTKDKTVLQYAIQKACAIKAAVVSVDEKENHVRATLNFGHTVGHAIEKALHYDTWLHGEAVAYGMRVAVALSYQRNFLSIADYDRIDHCLNAYGLLQPLPTSLNWHDVIHHLHSDKKIKQDRLRFILLSSIGNAVISDDITHDMIFAAWQHTQEAMLIKK